MDKKLLIIIPVYNEEESIGKFIQNIKKEKVEEIGDLLVINDGSTDDTESIVRRNQIKILNKPLNLGYGSTLQLGYKYASRKKYKYIIQIDGDGQHDVSNIRPIYKTLIGKNTKLDQCKECPDIVIASRFLSKENKLEISFMKNIAIIFFRKIIKIFTKEVITDPTSGLQGLNRNAFSFYSKYGNFDYKYPDINMIIQMLLMEYKITEVPGYMHPRISGEGMHDGIFKPIKYMVLISLSTISIIIRQRKSYYKLRRKYNDGGKDNE